MIRWSLFLALLVSVAFPCVARGETRTYTLLGAPVTVGGFNVEFPRQEVPTPSRTGYVVGMSARLVDMQGRAVTIRDVMLHHLVFFRVRSHPNPSACTGIRQEAFYGTGEENQTLQLPSGYGYRTLKEDRWKLNAMLMSHSTKTMRVRIEYRVTMVTGERMTGVVPFWVRANGCGESTSYPVWGGKGAGAVDKRSYRWRVPLDGRIVAVGGHLHGGAKDMFLSQPACGNRRLLDNAPRYGMPDHLYYTARPVLHEPGPFDTRYFLSEDGIQVRRGEYLDLTGLYDAEYPHPRVMAIMHIYVVPGKVSADRCPALPADARHVVKPGPARTDPPVVTVPLNALRDDGHTEVILDPPWPVSPLPADGVVALKDFTFSPARIRMPANSSITWRFDDKAPHNVTFANGPSLVGSPTLADGAKFTFRFAVPGRYELFCYLHPLAMHQVIEVT